MMSRLPIRVRLTLVFAGLTALVLVAIGSFVFLRFRTGLDAEINSGLRNQTQSILQVMGSRGLLPQGERLLIAPTEPITQIYRPDGSLVQSTGVLDSSPLLAPDIIRVLDSSVFFDAEVPTGQEVVKSRMMATRSDRGPVVLVGSPLGSRSSALARLALLLLIGGPLALTSTTWVAWRVAGGALKPVDDMRDEAATITATAPHLRLPVPPTGDEVARLGTTLNEMLDRLEEALTRERRFVDDASHELRTPLTNLRMELELALRRSRTKEELERALKSAYEESDRLGRLAEDLLVLARLEHGRLPVRAAQIDLSALTSEIVSSFAARAEGAGVEVATDVRIAQAELDPERIRQAMTNLMDNALRHSPRGGTVRVSIGRRNGSVAIEVSDSGEGFPEAFLQRAFEPFARPDGARSRDHGGTGLGLAIVRAVAESHGGSASARNEPGGGARVSLVLPLDRSEGDEAATESPV